MDKIEIKHDICYQTNLLINQMMLLSKSNEQEEVIIQHGLCGSLEDNISRSFAWKLFLKLYKPNEDSIYVIESLFDQQCKMNDEYNKKLFAINSKKKFQGDPLAHSQDTDWKSFYHETEIKKILKLDIMRTYQGTNLFQSKAITQILENVLLIWASENPDMSYRQGMNELAAVIICGLYPYYVKSNKDFNQEELMGLWNNKAYKDIYTFFHNEKYMESDVYHIFKALMEQGVKGFYDSGTDTRAVSYKIYELFTVQWNNEDMIEDTKLKLRADCIIKTKLKKINEDLFNHFLRIGLNSTVFFQRWLKCLFNREFDILRVIILWDAILAYRNELEFVDYISLGILNNLHNNLMKKNQDDAFQYIFDFLRLNKKNIKVFLYEVLEIKDYITKKDSKKKLPPRMGIKRSEEIFIPNTELSHSPQKVHKSPGSIDKTVSTGVTEIKEAEKAPMQSQQGTYISTALNSIGSLIKGVVSLELSPSSMTIRNPSNSITPNQSSSPIISDVKNDNIEHITLNAKETYSNIEIIQEIIGKYKNKMSLEDIDQLEDAIMFFKNQLVNSVHYLK